MKRIILALFLVTVLLVLASCRTTRDLPEPYFITAPPSVIRTVTVPVVVFQGYVTDIQAVILSIDGERQELAPDLSFSLSMKGLEDGRTYDISVILLSDGKEHIVDTSIQVMLQLGIEVPQVKKEEHSFTPTHTLSWEAESSNFMVEVTVDSNVQTVLNATETTLTLPEGVIPLDNVERGETVSWRVRVISPDGVLGKWSELSLIMYSLDTSLTLLSVHAERILTGQTVIRWHGVQGAVSYELEYWQDTNQENVQQITTTDTHYRLTRADMVRFVDTVVNLHVRAYTSFGEYSAWSNKVTFQYIPLLPAMLPVLSANEEIYLQLGSKDTRETKRLSQTVVMNRGFMMSRYELSNSLVAEIFNIALQNKEAYYENGAVFHTDTRIQLLGLRQLYIGQQFGLEWLSGDGGSSGRIGIIEGYGSHPAVGVSWYGAAFLANMLSIMESRNVVYEVQQNTVVINLQADGYRLPTEAEWAFAASRISQDGLYVEDRNINDNEKRSLNYMRSGDRWEDVESPYTGQGGPTHPVGALGTSNTAGIYDLIGNVWEWTNDWYDPEWYTQLADNINPAGPAEGLPNIYGQSMRVVRGTGWSTPQENLRITNRGSFLPNQGSHAIGIRLVRTIASETEQ